jgi:hypothetical protein
MMSLWMLLYAGRIRQIQYIFSHFCMDNCATIFTSFVYVKDSYNVGMKTGVYEV